MPNPMYTFFDRKMQGHNLQEGMEWGLGILARGKCGLATVGDHI